MLLSYIIINYVYIISAGVSIIYILIVYVSDNSICKSVNRYIFICLYIIHNPWYNIPYHTSYYPSVKEYLTLPSMLIYVSYELFQDTSYLCWIIVRN